MKYQYLNFKNLAALDSNIFLNTEPFPWSNPQYILTQEGFKRLYNNLPDVDLFDKSFGLQRAHGQEPHDRYELYYSENLMLPVVWNEFIDELKSNKYREWISQYFDIKQPFTIRFQWHYAVNGCSVSPHVDSGKKLGSHLFYFNTSSDWREEWDGSTLVLSSATTKHNPSSAPTLDVFESKISTSILDNHSFIFKNEENGWHAMATLNIPKGVYRHMFAVVIEKQVVPKTLLERVLNKISKNFSVINY